MEDQEPNKTKQQYSLYFGYLKTLIVNNNKNNHRFNFLSDEIQKLKIQLGIHPRFGFFLFCIYNSLSWNLHIH